MPFLRKKKNKQLCFKKKNDRHRKYGLVYVYETSFHSTRFSGWALSFSIYFVSGSFVVVVVILKVVDWSVVANVFVAAIVVVIADRSFVAIIVVIKFVDLLAASKLSLMGHLLLLLLSFMDKS